MWIIGFAEGGFVGPFWTKTGAILYRDSHHADRVANVYYVEPAHGG
jgi:hypothetical protein